MVKLYQAGLLPASYALSKLGYSDDEIAEIRSARTQDTTTTTSRRWRHNHTDRRHQWLTPTPPSNHGREHRG